MMTSTKIDKAERAAIRKEGKPIGLSLILYILITTAAAAAILLPGLLGGIPAMAPISTVVALICLAIAVYMLVYNRRLVAAWFKENAAQENRIEWLLSSGWTNLFLLLAVAGVVLSIHTV